MLFHHIRSELPAYTVYLARLSCELSPPQPTPQFPDRSHRPTTMPAPSLLALLLALLPLFSAGGGNSFVVATPKVMPEAGNTAGSAALVEKRGRGAAGAGA